MLKISKILNEMVNNNISGIPITKPNQELIIMVGIPGSGKSTMAKSIVGNGIIHSTDDLIEANGDYNDFFREMKEKNNFSALS
jgi:Fe-S cluster assembly ATPase SufC